MPVVKIGKSSELEVGEWVLAIGSPFGFDHSATAGIVSAKGRSLPRENYVPFIQTDVAINPGNSGGPLFNQEGEVVGVNSQIYSRTGGYMGLSFAIPVEVAMDVADQLKTAGKGQTWLAGCPDSGCDSGSCRIFWDETTARRAGRKGIARQSGEEGRYPGGRCHYRVQ